MNKIRFTKMHGCGNDYIYVNVMQNAITNPSAAAIAWSDRHKGIGSDGLVLIDKSPIPEADFSMRIFNADGSEAMMCGNASRCIGKYLYERALTNLTDIRLLTLSGVKTLGLHVSEGIVESVTVDMLAPALEDESQFDTSRGLDMGTFVLSVVILSLPKWKTMAASEREYGSAAAASPKPVAQEPAPQLSPPV